MSVVTKAQLENASVDADDLGSIINGASNETVSTRLGGIVKTVANAITSFLAPNPRGAWAGSMEYAIKDLVTESGNVYICTAAHTSGTFATDLASGDWAYWQNYDTNVKYISQYGDSLSAALTAIGSTETTLVIDSSINVSADATIPATLTLRIDKGGMLVRTGGTHLTINGPFEAGNWQCFSDNTTGHDWVILSSSNDVHPEWWGAAASPADSTDALLAAFQQTGNLILSNISYSFSSNLPQAKCKSINGSSEYASVLIPGSSVTIALDLASDTSSVKNLRIDGSNTTDAIGVYFGRTESLACNVESLYVTNFSGSSAVGIFVGDMLKSTFRKVTSAYNNIGLRIQGVSSNIFPTTITFDTFVATSSDTKGLYASSGQGIKFVNSIFESSGEEGIYLMPANNTTGIRGITFDSCWLEANYGSSTGEYQFVAGDGGALGGAIINFTMRDSVFQYSAGQAKHMRMNGSCVQNFLIDNPVLVVGCNSGIVAENGANGSVINSVSINISSVFVDDENRCTMPEGGWRRWTPIIASNVGDSSATFASGPTVSVSKFSRMGKTVNVMIHITGTLKAVTPSSFNATLPINIVPLNANANNTGIVLSINGVYQSGYISSHTDGKIYFGKSDASNFISGSTIMLRGSLVFEIN